MIIQPTSRILRSPAARRVLAGLLALFLVSAAWQHLLAQDISDRDPRPLRVAIQPIHPFVFVEDGRYEGFSIELWEEVAARLDRDFSYDFVGNVDEQLRRVQTGEADLAIAGISITLPREEILDFSHPYFTSGLQVMTRANAGGTWADHLQTIISLFVSTTFLKIIGGLLVVILVASHVFWLLERKRNPDFPTSYLAGIWEGIWYTVVTLVTVGYGDRTTRTASGRLAAMLWMFMSLFLLANFTATITSRLTLSHIEGYINGVEDLPGKRLVTVEESTAAQYAQQHHLFHLEVKTIEDAYAALEHSEADALIYDSPTLRNYAAGEGRGRVRITGEIFEPQYYGIAFSPGSALREPVNRALLEIIQDGTYRQIEDRWFDSSGD